MQYFKIKKILTIFVGAGFILLMTHCTIPSELTQPIQSKWIQQLENSNYTTTTINLHQDNQNLFRQGLVYLNQNFDFFSAESIFRHLVQRKQQHDWLYYKAKSTFLIGEYNYFPKNPIIYKLVYQDVSNALNLNSNCLECRILKAYSAGRIGLFLRNSQPNNLFAGLKYLLESRSILEQIIGVGDVGSASDKVILSIINRKGLYLDVLVDLAESYRVAPKSLGRSYTKALKLYRLILSKHPDFAKAYAFQGKVYQSKTNVKEAIQSYQRYVSLFESKMININPDTRYIYGQVLLWLAEIYLSELDSGIFLKTIQKHLEIVPRSEKGYLLLAEYHKNFLNDQQQFLIFVKKANEYQNLSHSSD